MSDRVIWGALGGIAGLGLAGLLMFGLASGPGRAAAVGTLILTGCAAFAVAGLAGFLFGLPVLVRGKEENEHSRLEPSSRIDEMAAWLSTLLLGATLTQVTNLVDWLSDVFTEIGGQLGSEGSASAVVGATCMFYGSLGFVSARLCARLYLRRIMTRADAVDQQVRSMQREAETALVRGRPEAARELTEQALDVLALAEATADSCERVRSDSASIPERSRRMGELVGQAKRQASAAGESLTRRQVRELFKTGRPGARICALAYMQARTDLVDVQLIADAIEFPVSAFEQYHVLIAALNAADGQFLRNDEGSVQALRNAMSQAESKGTLKESGDRSALVTRVLASLDRPVT